MFYILGIIVVYVCMDLVWKDITSGPKNKLNLESNEDMLKRMRKEKRKGY